MQFEANARVSERETERQRERERDWHVRACTLELNGPGLYRCQDRGTKIISPIAAVLSVLALSTLRPAIISS